MKTLSGICVLGTVLAMFLSGCGKVPAVEAEPSECVISVVEGLEISVVSAGREAVTFALCNTTAVPFCYEGHVAGWLELEQPDGWHRLQNRPDLAMTASFIWAEVPPEPEQHTITAQEQYGAPLSPGHYRVLAAGYTGFEALEQADAEELRTIAAEFDIT